jgi:lipopolysaccharide export LptBFGC system permease protein LptF
MKKLVPIFAAFAGILLIYSCSQPAPAANKKLEGNWKSKDGTTKLSITDKDFIMDDGQASKEDYFVKSDTIYTSYQGSRPYTKFCIKELTESKLTLCYPDSDIVEFSR